MHLSSMNMVYDNTETSVGTHIKGDVAFPFYGFGVKVEWKKRLGAPQNPTHPFVLDAPVLVSSALPLTRRTITHKTHTYYYLLLLILVLLLTTPLLTTYYSLLTTHYLLLTTHYLQLTNHYSLLTTGVSSCTCGEKWFG